MTASASSRTSRSSSTIRFVFACSVILPVLRPLGKTACPPDRSLVTVRIGTKIGHELRRNRVACSARASEPVCMQGWDAGQYLRFADERTRPALDLLARLDLAVPRRAIDLGCGPGNSTALLRERWPDAEIAGLDSSPDMLAAARRDHPGIDFIAGDIAEWAPAEPCDLVFSNAALQWVGDHARLLPRLLAAVAPGGALAVQMARNHDFATHALMRRVAAEGPWRDRLADARDPSPVRPPEFYYDCLASL